MHPEPGFYTVGIKSYGRAPTFLLLTGYEQVRSVTAAIAGDFEAADDLRLVLSETGVCSTDRGASRWIDRCCGGSAPADVDACCVADAVAKGEGKPVAGVGTAVSSTAGETIQVAPKAPSRLVVISVLGVTTFAGDRPTISQRFWRAIAADTGWSVSWVVGGLSARPSIAGLVSSLGRPRHRATAVAPSCPVSAGVLAVGLSALALCPRFRPLSGLPRSLIGLGSDGGLHHPAFLDSCTVMDMADARQSQRSRCLAVLRALSVGLFPHSSMQTAARCMSA